MPTPDVRLAVAGGVATLTLDSAHNRNALSRALRQRLAEQLARALADDAVRVLVLTHAGPVFCAGADLREPDAAPAPGAELEDLLHTLWSVPKPVVARLAGTARGGGTGLVAAADVAVAADTVTFAFPEVRLGVVPALISAPLRRRVAPRALQELFLTGEVFDAPRAAEIGLLTAVVPAEDLDAAVDRYVQMLLRGAPAALAATKELLAAPPPGGLAPELAALARLSARHFASPEAAEGRRAFAEKRAPAWAVDGPPTAGPAAPPQPPER
ncbi:enoyl-CoA hydratase-related protein [Georgenia sp. TF02-10]|uniref:enoyl-CoA hydratase-related protein n=1 Tax=Georgenia sp. TF02-10 TaxID=2917725 RepID=UPI001FA7504D|nr:enoyl-CoA hydratase-related protein [Georgenia sp. TF02-10]UNX53699.1 enoyl-CoA hydratase-related protein [Georgenia sp. TF02-10]